MKYVDVRFGLFYTYTLELNVKHHVTTVTIPGETELSYFATDN